MSEINICRLSDYIKRSNCLSTAKTSAYWQRDMQTECEIMENDIPGRWKPKARRYRNIHI
jgi:hypothetical protein